MSIPSESVQIFEIRLREQAKSLEQSATSLLEQGRAIQSILTPDAADLAALSYEKEMLFRQSTQSRSHLALVEKALVRIADGTFGECVSCGTVIGAKRLEAVPWTPHCIDCQERLERSGTGESSWAA